MLGSPSASPGSTESAKSTQGPWQSPQLRPASAVTAGTTAPRAARSVRTTAWRLAIRRSCRRRPWGRGRSSRAPGPRGAVATTGQGAQDPSRGDWGVASRQHNDEFWQYNTFQYWRNPLPPIDLADIEDLNEDTLTEATLQGRNEGAEVDMES
ncbi:hypothetical protein H8959_012856 [Pygathrix nigripes]